jgi:hypothetical protein
MHKLEDGSFAKAAHAVSTYFAEKGMMVVFIGNWALLEAFEGLKRELLLPSKSQFDVVVLGVRESEATKRIKRKQPGAVQYRNESQNGLGKKLILEWKEGGLPGIAIDVHFGMIHFMSV